MTHKTANFKQLSPISCYNVRYYGLYNLQWTYFQWNRILFRYQLVLHQSSPDAEDESVHISCSRTKLGPFPTLIKTLDSEPSGLVIPLSGFHGQPCRRKARYRPLRPGTYIFRTALFRSQFFAGSFIETDRIKITILKKTRNSATYFHHVISVPLYHSNDRK